MSELYVKADWYSGRLMDTAYIEARAAMTEARVMQSKTPALRRRENGRQSGSSRAERGFSPFSCVLLWFLVEVLTITLSESSWTSFPSSTKNVPSFSVDANLLAVAWSVSSKHVEVVESLRAKAAVELSAGSVKMCSGR